MINKVMESGEKYGHVTSLAFLNCLTHYGMGWDGMGWDGMGSSICAWHIITPIILNICFNVGHRKGRIDMIKVVQDDPQSLLQTKWWRAWLGWCQLLVTHVSDCQRDCVFLHLLLAWVEMVLGCNVALDDLIITGTHFVFLTKHGRMIGGNSFFVKYLLFSIRYFRTPISKVTSLSLQIPALNRRFTPSLRKKQLLPWFRIRIHMDPHWFGSPRSGFVFGMTIRIQEQGNCPKFTNKPDFQPLKQAFVVPVCFMTWLPCWTWRIA